MKPNVVNILIILLILMSLTATGFSVFFFMENTKQQESYAAFITNQEKVCQEKIGSQRQQKDEIADIFESQAALNDDLIDEQRQLAKASQDYINYMDKSVRFVNGQPQLLPNLTEKQFLEVKTNLLKKIEDLTKLSDENASVKEKNTARVKQIYIEAGEDRNNTANEREGFR